jgi:hypothetical protein
MEAGQPTATPREGTPGKAFLQRFGAVVRGVVSGFDRLVFRGKLRPLDPPSGMNAYRAANRVRRKDFKAHARAVTDQVRNASPVAHAKQAGRFRYLNSSQTSKAQVARQIAAARPVAEGLVGVRQCVEPCWTFDVSGRAGRRSVHGAKGTCSQLYHDDVHPQFGWMHVRRQTWFPFAMPLYVNGRAWLAPTLDREGLA